jgi:hypothetical protein
VFFWYGILTIGRWAGCFADIGWAWNIKPNKGGRRITAEFVESFLIFFYGSTNVFLEHLTAWGEEWSAQDLEHISITVMFFGGGLVSPPPPKSRRKPKLTEDETVRHAHRINPHTLPPERHQVFSNSSFLRLRGIPGITRAQILRLPNEPHPRARDPAPRTDDVLASPRVNGRDDDPLAMGDSARRGGIRKSCNLHFVLPEPPGKCFAW